MSLSPEEEAILARADVELKDELRERETNAMEEMLAKHDVLIATQLTEIQKLAVYDYTNAFHRWATASETLTNCYEATK